MTKRTFGRAVKSALALHGIKIVEVSRKSGLPYHACTKALSGQIELDRQDRLRLLTAAADIADLRRSEGQP